MVKESKRGAFFFKPLMNFDRKALTLALLAAVWLVASGCSAFPLDEKVQAGSAVSQDFYNTSLHEGMLAIRYIHLKSDDEPGDAILISTPDGEHHYLIDAGVPESGPQIDEALNRLDIQRLHGAINTHPHIDHIGGFTTLLRTKEIGKFYHNGISHTTKTYSKVQRLLDSKGVAAQPLIEGDVISLSPDVAIEVLSPPVDTFAEVDEWGSEQHNNHSLVLMLRHGYNRILLTGDLYKGMEYEMIERYGAELKADMMDAPHHGEETSSSESLIRTVNPQIAVFSANTLQSLNVLNRYEKEGIKVYTTGNNGNLLFVSDGRTIRPYAEYEHASN